MRVIISYDYTSTRNHSLNKTAFALKTSEILHMIDQSNPSLTQPHMDLIS